MKQVIVRLIACVTGFGCMAAHASCTNVDPSSILDLSHWKLTLPVDAHHGTSGEAAEVQAADLTAGYDSGYFCADPTGGVRFWAPVDGATTDDGEYPRSELRYMLDPDDDNANWKPDEWRAGLLPRLVVERVTFYTLGGYAHQRAARTRSSSTGSTSSSTRRANSAPRFGRTPETRRVMTHHTSSCGPACSLCS